MTANIDLENNKIVLDNTNENLDKLIIVTGFGPFDGHEDVNASWEAVKLLPDNLYDQNTSSSYRIEKRLVPVLYDEVDKAIENIWKKNPELVIHCGVDGGETCIQIEEHAYNNEFGLADYAGKKLECSTICLENNGTNCDKIYTKFNVKHIIDKVNPLCDGDKNKCVSSNNVGNYLCGYIYLKSLDKNSHRSLFVHVPLIKELDSNQVCDVLFKVIAECVRQIEENQKLK